MEASRVLLGPRLKVERANRHIDEIRSLTEPLDASLFLVRVLKESVPSDDGYPPRYNLSYWPKKPIPEMLAVIIGDAVHNLRSALDQIAGTIIRAADPQNGWKHHFPMHPERKSLETDAGLALIEKALPGAKKLLLEEIRPADGPNEAFWLFNSLSNLDKHNLIIPTVTMVGLEGLNVRSAGVRLGSIRFDAARPQLICTSDWPITIHDDFKASVEIRFAESGEVFQNEPVIPTLAQISHIVLETINSFARLMDS